jgi:putative tryptophan/tyrosine transport system substrate-binding protein
VTDRRAFIGALTSGLFVAPFAVLAQQPTKVYRIGVIGERSDTDPFLVAFRQGLRDLGYREGQNVIIEFRSTRGALDRVPALARELIRLPVDVIVVGGSVSAKHVMAETTTVPIVFALVGDPVGTGLVASLARPGGNATGMSNLQSELGAKQLELLKAVAPRITRVAVMYNPGSLIARSVLIGVVETARVLSIALQLVEVRQPDQLASALSTLAPQRAEALLVLSDPVFGSQLARIAQHAARHRLPAVYGRREFAAAGGLLAYGPNFEDNYRRAATYVDKILKGATPASLPVEQPTKFELVINLKTAKSLGLTIPQSLLLRADEVIR